jgi:hypothetical protein
MHPEGACFRWPQVSPGEVKVRLTPEKFTVLIGGMDLQAAKPRPWYRKEIDEVSAPRMNPSIKRLLSTDVFCYAALIVSAEVK